MQDLAAAMEALTSYDVEETKRALLYLVELGEKKALEHIMPLTAHPDVAIRHFAKRAVRMLRPDPAASAAGSSSSPSCSPSPSPASPSDAAPSDIRRRFDGIPRERRPEYFKVSIVI